MSRHNHLRFISGSAATRRVRERDGSHIGSTRRAQGANGLGEGRTRRHDIVDHHDRTVERAAGRERAPHVLSTRTVAQAPLILG